MKKINVAIADDHVIFREGLCEMLPQKFDRINILMQANNGKELIDKIISSKKLPDVCILDVDMPVLNGLETLIEIRRKWPNINLLILSLYKNEFTILKMLQYGANGYLTKACNYDEVCKAIVDICESGYYHSKIVSDTLLNYLRNEMKLKPILDISTRELEFLAYCSTDMTYKEIANKMNLSFRTIEGYYKSLSAKLDIHSRVGLAIFSINSGVHKRDFCNE
jgi:DNA-binding NarL/FixJ family response regulator